MGCTSCSSGKDGVPGGCQSKGSCLTGGCNKRNSFDWLAKMDIPDYDNYEYVEVSFHQGSRMSFYKNPKSARAITGDIVLVESDVGYDIGSIALSGELVRLQMKKKKVNDSNVLKSVIRVANDRDLEKMTEARAMEKRSMIQARKIAKDLALDMKIGDVEFQADKRKATFYYTAEGRVDFRELIRHFAKEFKVKIEMRQIGARQESARIGGIGSCGRELCCSTWLTDFKTVSTTAARYQNLAINQAKLSGQCGRLKCCLNYELDTYMEALEAFPDKADVLETEAGRARLVKTDIFKGIMFYAYITEGVRGQFHQVKVDRVKEILALNKEKKKPAELNERVYESLEKVIDYESVNDVIELPMEKRKKKKRRPNKNKNKGPRNKTNTGKPAGKSNNTNKENSNSPNQSKDKASGNQNLGNKKPYPKKKKKKPFNKNRNTGSDNKPEKKGPDNKQEKSAWDKKPAKKGPENKQEKSGWDKKPAKKAPDNKQGKSGWDKPEKKD